MTFYLSVKLVGKKFSSQYKVELRHKAKKNGINWMNILYNLHIYSHGNGNGLAENEWKVRRTGGNLNVCSWPGKFLSSSYFLLHGFYLLVFLTLKNFPRPKQFYQGSSCDDDPESLSWRAKNVPEGAEKDCGDKGQIS